MATHFVRLNDEWNAEPNAPMETVQISDGDTVVLEFYLNSFAFTAFTEEHRGRLIFEGVTKYRLGPPNDEGWYRGKCRFSGLAPEWGEFYEINGELFDEAVAWQFLSNREAQGSPRTRYLFYLRDRTFECDALTWRFDVIK